MRARLLAWLFLPDSVEIIKTQLENCLTALHYFFCINGLSLNPDKSDAIWFTTPQRARSLPPAASISVAGTIVPISNTITTLGVTLDTHLTFNSHITALSKSCNFHIRALRHIRKSLTDEMAHSIAVALVSSRLDYANSVLLVHRNQIFLNYK